MEMSRSLVTGGVTSRPAIETVPEAASSSTAMVHRIVDFAVAGRSDQDKEFAVGHRQADVVDGRGVVGECLGHMIELNVSHSICTSAREPRPCPSGAYRVGKPVRQDVRP